MNNGWIKLHRKILDNPVAKKPHYLALWVHLLLRANHEEAKMIWNGDILIIHEGQFITGRKELAKETGIPESTVEDILKFLEKQGQIRQQKTTKYRLITILNWKTHQESNNRATTEQQQADTNKNDKKNKNIYTQKFVKPTLEEIRAYCGERKNKVDAVKFYNHYESNGWKVGRNPMKDWHAAVRTWERSNYDRTPVQNSAISDKAQAYAKRVQEEEDRREREENAKTNEKLREVNEISKDLASKMKI